MSLLVYLTLIMVISIIQAVDYYLLVNNNCSNELNNIFSLSEFDELKDLKTFTILNCEQLSFDKDNRPLCKMLSIESYPILIAFSDTKYYQYKSILNNQYELINIVTSDDLRFFGLVNLSERPKIEKLSFPYFSIICLWLAIRMLIYIILA